MLYSFFVLIAGAIEGHYIHQAGRLWEYLGDGGGSGHGGAGGGGSGGGVVSNLQMLDYLHDFAVNT